jgi:hypothetical protein
MSNRAPVIQRLFVGWLVVAVIAGLASVRDVSRTGATFTALQPADNLMHTMRGDPAGVYRFAQAVGSYRLGDTRAYINEIYRLAPQVGLDPAIMIGQSALETGYWKGRFWLSSLNPAGIGIYDDFQPTSFYWATGTDAARGHIYHLYTYAAGVPPPGHILYQYRNLTPGVENAVRLGFAGTKTTIQSLEGSWALMSLYAKGLCNKGNEILNFIDRTSPTATATPRAIATLTASDGNNPLRTTDRDLNTSWAIIGYGVPPARGYLTYDLGETIRLSSIKWAFRRTGYADYVSIRASLDRATWTTLKVVGNAPAKQWQTLNTTATARYIRFVFRNPNLDPDLGYLAEVAFSGLPPESPTPTASATATAKPTAVSLGGSIMAPIGSDASSDSSPSTAARDGNIATDWRTLASPPPNSAWVSFDLGGTATLSGARWYLSQPNCGTSVAIEGSVDNQTWEALASGNTTSAGNWQAAAFNGSARFVRFGFDGPAAIALGCLAEAEIWGTGFAPSPQTSTPGASAPADASPSPATTMDPSAESSAASLEETSAPTLVPSLEPSVSPTETSSFTETTLAASEVVASSTMDPTDHSEP